MPNVTEKRLCIANAQVEECGVDVSPAIRYRAISTPRHGYTDKRQDKTSFCKLSVLRVPERGSEAFHSLCAALSIHVARFIVFCHHGTVRKTVRSNSISS